jgi:hypothetical protein
MRILLLVFVFLRRLSQLSHKLHILNQTPVTESKKYLFAISFHRLLLTPSVVGVRFFYEKAAVCAPV